MQCQIKKSQKILLEIRISFRPNELSIRKKELKIQKNVMEYYLICSSLLKLETKIAFATVINEKGRIEEFQTRGTILDFLSHKRESFFKEYALQYGMRKEYDEDFGQVGYTCDIEKKNIIFNSYVEFLINSRM